MKQNTLTNHNDDDNKVIEISILEEDGQLYNCAGVLVKENSDVLEIAFSARNNIIHDYLEIKKEYIKNIRFIKEDDINMIG
jgi:uncharacterized protein YutE (UPF0331/DUF86 family)